MRKLKLDELGRLSPEEYQQAEKRSIHIVLDNLRSGMNVGSFFRTSDAFRIEKIWLCGITPTPPNNEINKTALGSQLTVDWEYSADVADVLSQLKIQNFAIQGIEQTTHSHQLQDVAWDFPLALVFGNEVEGISSSALALIDSFTEIPQFGTKHSFNVSVCAGIVLWEATRRLLVH